MNLESFTAADLQWALIAALITIVVMTVLGLVLWRRQAQAVAHREAKWQQTTHNSNTELALAQHKLEQLTIASAQYHQQIGRAHV